MSEWNPQTGYENYNRGGSFPKRSFGAGSTRGISMKLSASYLNHVNQCNDQMHHGFNVKNFFFFSIKMLLIEILIRFSFTPPRTIPGKENICTKSG